MNHPASILLVSSDLRLTTVLSEQLRLMENVDVAVLPTAEAALAEGDGHAIWLIDENLPGVASLVEIPRAKTPIILLGKAGDPANELVDVDDVLPRPLRLRHLLTRIEALLVGQGETAQGFTRIGPFQLRPAEKLLVDEVAERRIRLTEKEVAILEFLAEAREPMSREALLNEIWGYQAGVTSHTLETHVYRLRQKIEADPANAAILINEAGGYRLAS